MNTMDIRLQQAIAAARAGKRDEARVLLDRFLADEPEDVHGIFLRSTLATSKEEQVGNEQAAAGGDDCDVCGGRVVDCVAGPWEGQGGSATDSAKVAAERY